MVMRGHRRFLRQVKALLSAAAVACNALTFTGILGANAQTSDKWPSKPIRLVVPFPAGSGTDIPARIIAQKLTEVLGQQVIVENRAGASGTIGAEAVARAEPDGYTLGLVTASTHALAPALNSKLSYHPVNDFAPVGMIGGTPYVLVIYPGLAAKDVKELLALAKAKPGTLNYGSAGPASLAHLAGELFASMSGVTMTHVPYKASAQSVTDMIAGRLDMQFATVGPMLSNIRAGQVRALAVTSSERVGALPDVPTIAEAGVPNYEASLWMAIVAPAKTPAPIVERLNRELNIILDNHARQALADQGVQLMPGKPEQVHKWTRTDLEKWKQVISKANVQAPAP
jgi:tripartite-type tricarboxylate transporter receptor subunit TctC